MLDRRLNPAIRAAARSGGNGNGRFSRDQHDWMADRYGNLDTPLSYSTTVDFLTWLGRLAPGQDTNGGANASTVYRCPIYWGTQSVRPAVAK